MGVDLDRESGRTSGHSASGSDESHSGGGPSHASGAPPKGVDAPENYDRDLGVIEAINYVTRSCPSGVVVGAAERALDAIKAGGSEVLKDQAYFVLIAIKGWRGERATQVHRSLTRFLESAKDPEPSPK